MLLVPFSMVICSTILGTVALYSRVHSLLDSTLLPATGLCCSASTARLLVSSYQPLILNSYKTPGDPHMLPRSQSAVLPRSQSAVLPRSQSVVLSRSLSAGSEKLFIRVIRDNGQHALFSARSTLNVFADYCVRQLAG